MRFADFELHIPLESIINEYDVGPEECWNHVDPDTKAEPIWSSLEIKVTTVPVVSGIALDTKTFLSAPLSFERFGSHGSVHTVRNAIENRKWKVTRMCVLLIYCFCRPSLLYGTT